MRKIIVRNMIKMVAILMFVMLSVIFLLQVLDCQRDMRSSSVDLFEQINQLMDENNEELEQLKDEYHELCLDYADAIAYILSEDESLMDDKDELNKIADFMQVDEIHIFDDKGTIIKGTVPKYYGLTIYDGEQIGFFAQMYEDKNMRLCQEITPNTSEGKEIQYAAVWNETGEYVIQVGVVPERVLNVLDKNSLQHIFSHFAVESGTYLYAIDKTTNVIIASTNESAVGQSYESMDMKRTFKSERTDFHAKIYGVHSYCYAQDMGDVVLLRVHNSKALYGELLATTGTVGICLILLAVLLAMIIVKYLDKKIVQGIYDINRKLTVITEGNFDETVDVDVTPEFKELSNYINIMINSILSTTDKISNILNKAMLPLGIYEYNDKMTRVRATDYINKILPLSDNNVDMFEECINSIKNNPVEGHNNVFMIEGEEPVYVMLEEFKSGNETTGMLMDVTENVKYDIKLKNERDRDVLTGLYNRRGLENRLDKLFETTDNLGHSAMVMIDSDGLKMINDTYGHRNGDTYLLKVRDVINEVRPANSIFARQGGDEFILFIYGCQTEKELRDYIQLIENQRDRMVLSFDNQEVKVRYSMGYAFFKDQNTDYEELIREADDNMYVDKKSRKKQA